MTDTRDPKHSLGERGAGAKGSVGKPEPTPVADGLYAMGRAQAYLVQASMAFAKLAGESGNPPPIVHLLMEMADRLAVMEAGVRAIMPEASKGANA